MGLEQHRDPGAVPGQGYTVDTVPVPVPGLSQAEGGSRCTDCGSASAQSTQPTASECRISGAFYLANFMAGDWSEGGGRNLHINLAEGESLFTSPEAQSSEGLTLSCSPTGSSGQGALEAESPPRGPGPWLPPHGLSQQPPTHFVPCRAHLGPDPSTDPGTPTGPRVPVTAPWSSAVYLFVPQPAPAPNPALG